MATPAERAFMPGYFAIHDGLRKDVRRMRVFEKRGSSITVNGCTELRTWFDRVHEPMIMGHHHGEDTFFIPRLITMIPSFKGVADVIQAEHHLLDDRMGTLKQAMGAYEKDGSLSHQQKLVSAIHEYTDLVERHLRDEEPLFAGAIMRELTKEQFDAMEGEYRKKHGSKKAITTAVPWIMDAASRTDIRQMTASMPRPMYWLIGIFYLWRWKPAYKRLTKHLPAA